ncbi:aldehyde dehydrogenase family protein [Streptomyces aidingensis]|uniref:aldehyde dehydrogenase (NAD(+)) n=1 Tax=Streptomyces aidingensis TaxID=910347 RepID=A0A1I1SR50_9ACTN|nr:aldehyde dehydrogenase family protein [Streptomyces aidingensis]SFD45540.1 aldehyde dehydrogenase (NAD+) [Streptomyces aidingensis]
MQAHEGQYVGGEWRPSAGTEVTEVVNPATEEVIATVPRGTAADVDAAVTAAGEAAPRWGASTREERLTRLTRLRDGLVARKDEIARTVTAELGSPIRISELVHAGTPIAVTDAILEVLDGFPFEEKIGNSVVYAEPAGVVGAITPWNYPLHQIVAKVVPALAAGCTVVLKPADDTPLVARLFAEIVHDAGFPAGTFNLVTGPGSVVGSAIAEHPGVDMVSFTGSTAVGRRVGAAAGSGIKRVSLELGGKSANVVLPGADLATAVARGVNNAFLNGGQTCSAWTRMLVAEADQEQAVELAARAAEKYLPGDPADPATRLGPMVSAAQRDDVRRYIETGIKEGARLVAGGPEAPRGVGRGHYVRATVFADVRPDMVIAQEEIFGPVLCIMPYRDEEHALALANSTSYGLSGAVWAADRERAVAFARRMETGQVDINGGAFNPAAPFGGYKQSGVGRELGRFGLEEFTQPKSLQF